MNLSAFLCRFLMLGAFARLVDCYFCPSGYTLFQNVCYQFSATQISRASCVTTCSSLGGAAQMACIQNQAQNDFIWSRRVGQFVWVNYQRDPTTLVFKFPSTCVTTFINFAAGEGGNTAEMSTIMYFGFNGQWIDMATTSANAMCACEIPASPDPTSQPSSQPTSRPSRQPTQPSAQPSCQPSSLPSVQPSTQPSSQPVGFPSSQPSTQPSAQPSQQPSVQYDQIIRSSPTFGTKNGFAFAAVDVNGTVHTWGEGQHGGDSSAVQHLLYDVVQIVPARFSFTALLSNATVVPWGAAAELQGFAERSRGLTMRSVAASESAYAVVDATTGAVTTFGSRHSGGGHSAANLGAGVDHVVASVAAFAAVKVDGTVYAWGNALYGGAVPTAAQALLLNVYEVVASREAFAALTRTGRVIAWGSAMAGGDSSSAAHLLSRWVTHVSASRTGFVAFRKDSQLAVWGHPVHSDTSAVAAELIANVTFVAHTCTASAALKADGSVTTWGKADGGGASSAVQVDLVQIVIIYGNSKAFAALTSTGKVVAWGKAAYGGQIPSDKVSALSSGVVSLYHTDRAFVALKSGGTVVVWGQAGHGGSPGAAVEAHLVSGVHTICSNDVAFSVIKTDGSVVGWGHPVSVPTEGVLFTSSNLKERAVCA